MAQAAPSRRSRYDKTNPFSLAAAVVVVAGEIEAAKRLAPGRYRSLSRTSGIPRHHVSRILRGLVNPTLPTIARLAQAAGITTAALVDHLDRVQAQIAHEGAGR